MLTQGSFPAANNPGITDVTIGDDDAASGQNLGYHGQLSDFAIFNSALTQTQVDELVEFGPAFFTPEPSSALASAVLAHGITRGTAPATTMCREA